MSHSTSSLKGFTRNKSNRVLKYTHRISDITIITIPESFLKELAVDDMALFEEILTEDGIFLKPFKKSQEGKG